MHSLSDLLTLIMNDVAEAVLKARFPFVVLLVTVHVGYQVLLIQQDVSYKNFVLETCDGSQGFIGLIIDSSWTNPASQ